MIYNYLLYKLESSKRKAKELVGSKTSRSFQDRDYIATIISCQFSCVRYVSIFQNVNVKGWHYTAEINDPWLDKT